MEKTTLQKAEDYENLYAFMREIWFDTYDAILPREQNVFLLHKYFDAENIEAYLRQGYRYYYLLYRGERAGLLVYVDRGREIYLDKLYVLPPYRGKHISSFAFEYLKSFGKDVALTVNRANERALAVYLHNGFAVEKIQENVQKNGMVNHDYEMRWKARKEEKTV